MLLGYRNDKNEFRREHSILQ